MEYAKQGGADGSGGDYNKYMKEYAGDCNRSSPYAYCLYSGIMAIRLPRTWQDDGVLVLVLFRFFISLYLFCLCAL